MNIVGGSSRSVSGSAPPLRIQNLQIPKISTSETSIVATPKRVYGNAHAYHINSISCNSDGEHFLSADDLRVNLWNLERSDQCFNMLDIKPNNMEDLTEVITSAEFHPTHCNIFIYSSSGGSIRLGDMRASSLCDSHAMMFEEPEDPSTRSFFSEIISSVSDVKFTKDGRYLISRDYLNLKIWDVNMESKPVKTIAIHDHLRPKLCDLYENDCIFDKFESAVSADGQNYVTGSYNNNFHIYDRYGKVEKTIEATNAPETKGKGRIAATPKKKEKADDKLDFTKKALHTAWHPQQNTVAITISSNLYIYHGEPV
jgi:serine/threonine-protein phosphatase 2A regulatory subunit B